jgi:DNA-binding LytR/AlgR family response regulator
MKLPPPKALVSDEHERLEALHRYGIIDTEPEPVFNDLAQLAAYVCGTPMALVSLLDAKRLWLKASVGIDISELPLEQTFCQYTLRVNNLFEIPDTQADARYANNPMVAGAPHIRFYVGVPLLTPDGQPLGTLCAFDTVPRTLSTDQREALWLLARQAMAHLELRRTRLLLDDERQKLEGVIRLAGRTDALVPASSRPEIFVKQDQRLLRVPTVDLLYVEALGDYVNLYLSRERLTIYGTMKDLETKLSGFEFARIHRKYIVRLDRIMFIDGDSVMLDGGSTTGPGRPLVRVAIGSSYKAGLLARLTVI